MTIYFIDGVCHLYQLNSLYRGFDCAEQRNCFELSFLSDIHSNVFEYNLCPVCFNLAVIIEIKNKQEKYSKKHGIPNWFRVEFIEK
jgi:hypothetical protein